MPSLNLKDDLTRLEILACQLIYFTFMFILHKRKNFRRHLRKKRGGGWNQTFDDLFLFFFVATL